MHILTLLLKTIPLQHSNANLRNKVKSSAWMIMLSFCFCCFGNPSVAQQTPADLDKAPADLKLDDLFGEPTSDSVRWLGSFLTKNPDWALSIDERTVTLHSFKTTVKGSIEIPRLATMIESIKSEVRDGECEIKLDPQLNTWKLSWDASKLVTEDGFELIITMQCNDRPVTMDQVSLITAQADGIVRLPAHRAVTSGAAVRYEPQSFKNTVGWWSKSNDKASWSFEIRQPGRYSIALLAGCGAGQGGSQIQITAHPTNESKVIGSVSFTVAETGHFQNFQWRTVGEIEFPSAGTYRLTAEAIKLAKNAAMDLREVQLVRQAK